MTEAFELESWRDWLDLPETQTFLKKALPRLAEGRREQWLEMSWEGGAADQTALVSLRAQHDMLIDLSNYGAADIVSALADEGDATHEEQS